MKNSWSRRDLLRRSAFLAGGVALGPALLSACGGSSTTSLESLKKKGTITVGIAGEQPYGFQQNGKLTGEDPTIQKAIWGALGIDTVDAKQTEFDGLIPGLKAHHFDVVAAGMFITPDRCKNAIFSDPVYCAPEAFLVRKGNPKNLTDFPSVADSGATLGVFNAAVESDYAKEAGVDQSKIKTMPNQQSAITQLKQGRIDAIALTSISLNWALQHQSAATQKALEVTKGFFPTVNGKKQLGCGGAVFRPEDTDLRDAFNKQLAKLKKSGKLLELIKPFGFDESTIPPDDVTTKELCKG